MNPPGRRLFHRPGLRTTITVAFGFGALMLSALMAVGTYVAARNYLVDQREHNATRQAFVDAAYVRDGLLTSGAKVSDVLASVSPPADAAILVKRYDRWFSSSLVVAQRDIPATVRRSTSDGQVTVTWQDTDRGPAILVGVPLPAVNAQFYERVRPTELVGTVNTLRIVLTIVAALTALAGAVLGRWAAGRVVAPLDEVAGAAARIASGALSTRLPGTDDPDLATIVASFNSMVDAVNERIERDARFAADVSHELRSPLTTLMTSVDLLNRRADELSPRSRQALALIDRDLVRFRRALEDLLDLGRLEAGAAGLQFDRLDVGALVRHVAAEADVPESRLTLPGADGPPACVNADKVALTRAVRNLVENATLHGDGVTSLAVSVRRDSVFVAVDDAGAGVPPEERTRIFERFARGGSRGSRPGTGLGLSLVAETVRAHGGAVWCTDAPGGGGRFVVRLPRVEEEE